MGVWITHRAIGVRRGSVFHLSPLCPRAKRPHHRPEDWTEVLPLELPNPVPCRFCFPDAPRAPHRRVPCPQGCSGPCRHAGGILVAIHRSRQGRQLEWVWPERSVYYEVVSYDLAQPIPMC